MKGETLLFTLKQGVVSSNKMNSSLPIHFDDELKSQTKFSDNT